MKKPLRAKENPQAGRFHDHHGKVLLVASIPGETTEKKIERGVMEGKMVVVIKNMIRGERAKEKTKEMTETKTRAERKAETTSKQPTEGGEKVINLVKCGQEMLVRVK